MNKRRVAIMTWHTHHNYGTALQAVALNHVINSLGYIAQDVDYDPLLGADTHTPMTLSSRLLRKTRWLRGVRPINLPERESKFDLFLRQWLPLTGPIRRKDDLVCLNGKFDAFVCGSDQIWSPRCFDPSYYLDFVDEPRRKIAYAPSFGCDSLDGFSCRDSICKLLSSFGALSVRESTGKGIVRSAAGRDATQVLDPTLLLTANEWRGFSSQLSFKEGYCLFYFLGEHQGNRRAARKVALSRGLEVVEIPVFEKYRNDEGVFLDAVGPAEFLSLFLNANLVCTDSFHGMVFATIFQKDLVAFERFDPNSSDSQNTRVYSFLEMAGAEDALLPRHELDEWQNHIGESLDYSCINLRIEAKRSDSIGYLRSALARATADRAGDH